MRTTLVLAVALSLSFVSACGGESEVSEPETAAVPAPAPGTSAPAAQPTAGGPQGVAVTVNGEPITEAELAGRVWAVVQQQTGGRQLPPQQLEQFGRMYGPQVLEVMIGEKLLSEDIADAEFTVSDEVVRAHLDRNVHAMLFREGITPEEFAERLQLGGDMSLEEYMGQQAANEDFRRMVLFSEYILQTYPEDVAVTDEAIAERYAEDLDSIFTRPPAVRASHILVGTEGQADPAAAQAKAAEIAAAAKAEDADFGALAMEHSTCPSAPRGGDLGFFPRTGMMAEPFAAAAFELEVGELSDVVETQFGYHVIKVTDRRDEKVFELAEVEDVIRNGMREELMVEVRERHLAMLRDKADIRFPEPTGM